MQATWCSLLALSALAAWLAAALALLRAAERRACAGCVPPHRLVVAAAAAAALLAVAMRTPADALRCGVACVGLIVAAAGDARTGYLFDAVTFPTAAAAAVLAVAAGAGGPAAWGVALVVVPFWGVVFFSNGRAMGLGDVKAMYALAAAFGPLESFVAIFAASMSGLALAALRGRLRSGTEIRFGPHLAAGAAIALVAGRAVASRLNGF